MIVQINVLTSVCEDPSLTVIEDVESTGQFVIISPVMHSDSDEIFIGEAGEVSIEELDKLEVPCEFFRKPLVVHLVNAGGVNFF